MAKALFRNVSYSRSTPKAKERNDFYKMLDNEDFLGEYSNQIKQTAIRRVRNKISKIMNSLSN